MAAVFLVGNPHLRILLRFGCGWKASAIESRARTGLAAWVWWLSFSPGRRGKYTYSHYKTTRAPPSKTHSMAPDGLGLVAASPVAAAVVSDRSWACRLADPCLWPDN